jgi:DNA-binding MarR family transcriptional regulator
VKGTYLKDDMIAWIGFLRAHATVVRYLEREMMEKEQLPLQWYEVLGWLKGAPQRKLRMQELAEQVMLSHSGLTRLLDRMVQAGLVRRASCEEDRRGVYALLTSKGLLSYQQAEPTFLRGVREYFLSRLGADDIKALQIAFLKILRGDASEILGTRVKQQEQVAEDSFQKANS